MKRETIIGLTILIIMIVGSFLIATKGAAKHEKHECIKWQEDSKQYQNWYAKDWQVDQCERYNINLN